MQDAVNDEWEKANKRCEELEIPSRPQQRPPLLWKRSETHVVELPSRESARDFHSVEQYRAVIFLVIDRCLSELERRFTNANISIMNGIDALTPGKPNFLNITVVTEFGKLFECCFDDLKIEVQNCQRLLHRKAHENKAIPKTMLEFQGLLLRLRDAFYELDRLLTIACTLPVSSCECERSFSTLRIVKNYLRSSLSDARLNNLILLGVHSERAEQLNLNDVIDRFAAQRPKSRIMLA